MKHILWIRLKGFFAGNDPVPTAVERDGFVLDVNKAAHERGLRVGISMKQARNIIRDGIFNLWERDEFEARSQAWLNTCVDFTGVIEPADQHAAWLDFSLHPRPVDVAEKLIRVLSRQTGLTIEYGAGPSKWIAFLAAKHYDCGEAARDPAKFLSGLTTSNLLPVSKECRDRLRFLGYQTIGQVAQLPLKTLQDQFGEQGYLIHTAAKGTLRQNPEAKYPPGSVAESLVFDGAADNSEMIYEAARRLAHQIGNRLTESSQQSGKLLITLELEDGSLKKLSRTFTKPLRCPRSVNAALKLLLEPALKEPIAAIRALVPELSRVKAHQAHLIPEASPKSTIQIDAALRHVRTVFGDKAVQAGAEIELPRRVKVLKEWKDAIGWR